MFFFAKDGAHALQKLPMVQPDVVLTDILMPRVDGFELYDTVHKVASDMLPHFVFMSAAMNEEIQKGIAERNVPLLKKPIYEKELKAVLSELIPT